MTQAEYDAEAAQFEPPNKVAGKPLSDAQWAGMKRGVASERRRRGRPSKPKSEHVARVLVAMPRDLLRDADAVAKRTKVSRSELIADSLRLRLAAG